MELYCSPKIQFMEYNRIVAVTGMPGLYEVLNSKADGAIVRSLEDKTTKFVSSRIHNLSHLESIEIYTIRDNVSLSEIFTAMKASKEKMPDVKDNQALKNYFEKVYPDMDFERVYASDMKKMVKWFEILQANEIDFTPKAEETPAEAPATGESEVAEKPARATKAKAKTEEKAKEEDAPKAEATKKTATKAATKTAAKKAATKKEEPKARTKAAAEEKPKAKAAAKTATKSKSAGKKKDKE